MKKVVIIGGGIAGMMAAINITDSEVIIIEHTDKCGKKILLTGNGKCNYWNKCINTSFYNTDNYEKLEEIISIDNQNKVLDKLYKLGIYPRIKNNYYYPYSNQATSIRNILLSELKRKNINIIYNANVTDISKEKDKFIIKINNEEILADKLVLATGSNTLPKTGSDGSGYVLASNLGHKINLIYPSLVPLKVKYPLKECSGVRIDSKVSLYINNNKIKEELGELQLTDYGLSGICIFNLSGIASKNINNHKVDIEIDFMPNLDTDFYTWMNNRNNIVLNNTIEELLESIFPYKLLLVLLKEAGIDRYDYWDKIDDNKKNKLSNLVSHFRFNIIDTESFDRCQVTTGGVSLNQINPNNMESLICKDLYIVGELLDVDGMCGGYNIAFSLISGYLAGRGV